MRFVSVHDDRITEVEKIAKKYKNYKVYIMPRKLYNEMTITYRKGESRPSIELYDEMFSDIRRPIP